jgi:nicotinamide riboside transporter PnuC
MNYIAGSLYIYLQNEEQTFAAFAGVIKNFNMETLLNENLHRLKLYFYILDRVIGLYIPRLHEHFRDEMVTSAHISSSWFITLYSNMFAGELLL